VTVPASQQSPVINMAVSGEGPAEVMSFATDQTGAASIMMTVQDGQAARQPLMNTSIHMGTIFGTGALPYRLPESLLVDENRFITCSIQNLTAAPNAVRLCCGAIRTLSIVQDPKMERLKVRLRRKQFLSLPYWYTFDQRGYAELAGAATGNFQISIEDTAHFELHTLTALASVSLDDIDILIVDANRQEPLLDAFGNDSYWVPAPLITGVPGYPFKLHEPRFLECGTKLIVQVRNRNVATNRLYLTLGGRRLVNRIWK
jgi:hypothetical protein